MAKGSVITNAFVDALGLGASSYTLTAPLKNILHPALQEPMFTVHIDGMNEVVYIDRQYCFDNQFAPPPSYGAGDKLLLWIRRVVRHRNNDAQNPATSLLMASDCFLYDQPREFQRFRLFLRSKRILDTQARDFLARFGDKFSQFIKREDGLRKVLTCLGNIAEWPDPENGFRKNSASDASLEGLAKQYSKELLPVRDFEKIPHAILACSPEQRVNIFRLLCFLEDGSQGGEGLMVFLRDMGTATGADLVIRKTAAIKSPADLGRALEILRNYLGLPIG